MNFSSELVAYAGGPRGPGPPPWRKICCGGVRVKKFCVITFIENLLRAPSSESWPPPLKNFCVRHWSELLTFSPLLKELRFSNNEAQSQISDKLDLDDNQVNLVVEYPHLIWLQLVYTHIDYVEQFLNETKTHLPRLAKLTIDYDQLASTTENFTRETTRLNCARVKRLFIEKTLAFPKDFFPYFPLL